MKCRKLLTSQLSFFLRSMLKCSLNVSLWLLLRLKSTMSTHLQGSTVTSASSAFLKEQVNDRVGQLLLCGIHGWVATTRSRWLGKFYFKQWWIVHFPPNHMVKKRSRSMKNKYIKWRTLVEYKDIWNKWNGDGLKVIHELVCR